MASPEDNIPKENILPDGRSRRQPPIIDIEAVEVSPDGARTAAAGSGSSGTSRARDRILVSLSALTLAIIGSVCVVAGIVAVVFLIYSLPGGVDAPERSAAGREAAAPDDVIERISKLEAILKASLVQASPDKAPDNDLANRVAALDTGLVPLTGRIAELERDIRDVAAAARAAGQRADRLAGLLDEAKKNSDERDSLQRRQHGTLEDIADRLKMLESAQALILRKQAELAGFANASPVPDKAVRVAIVAAALRSAVERDSPFTVELAAARSLGVDETALASLEPFAAIGIPTRNELFRTLSTLLPELLHASVPPGRDLGYLDRLQASATKMMNIRPVRDEPGDEPAAVISRIEFKMVRQDIAEVVAEMDKLPAPARELAQPWRMKALARQNAVVTARRIATASLTELGEPAVQGSAPR